MKVKLILLVLIIIFMLSYKAVAVNVTVTNRPVNEKLLMSLNKEYRQNYSRRGRVVTLNISFYPSEESYESKNSDYLIREINDYLVTLNNIGLEIEELKTILSSDKEQICKKFNYQNHSKSSPEKVENIMAYLAAIEKEYPCDEFFNFVLEKRRKLSLEFYNLRKLISELSALKDYKRLQDTEIMLKVKLPVLIICILVIFLFRNDIFRFTRNLFRKTQNN